MSKKTTDRNFNDEVKSEHRDYFYDFDSILRRYMIRSFRPFLKAGKTLEMGCFEGVFTELIVKELKLADLTVVEAASDCIDVAKKRVGAEVQFVHSMFEDFEPTQKFENIFLVHTLEHLDDPVGVLAKVKSWLTETGRLILCVPNADAPSRQIAVKMGLIEFNGAITDGERDHGHRATYSFDTLEAVVRKSGLKIQNRGGVLFKPLANFQFDKILAQGLISPEYVEGCYAFGMQHPELSASIFMICGKSDQ